MQDFLAAATIVVRRRGETVIASRNAIDKHPVVLPALGMPGRFEIRDGTNAEDGKHFAIVWAPLPLTGEEPTRLRPLLLFRDADDARAALLKIEKAFTRPWWRKAVRVYQVLGFIVALLGTIAFWNTLTTGHPPVSSASPVTGANVPQSADTTAATPNGLDPAMINALIERQRAAIQNHLPPSNESNASAALPDTPAQVPSPYTIQPPAAAASNQAPISPGDAVTNALNAGKK